MLEKSLVNMILVMPIYKGQDLFLGAIDSIEQLHIPFEKIILSFNEAQSNDYNLFVKSKNAGRYSKDYTILRTGIELDSVGHGLFIADKLSASINAECRIFFLAHDDRILNKNYDLALHDFLLNARSDTVYFPSYSCCKSDDYNFVFEIIESDKTLTSEDFFWLTQKNNVPTSMSGMIVSFGAWKEALKVMLAAGSGARFEHLLSIASVTKNVCFNKVVNVLVAQRKGSDADHLNIMQHRISSFFYVLTFIKNRRLHGLGNYLRCIWLLSKKIVAIALQLIFNIFYK